MSSSTAANQVRASHILIKHQGSRRKASWKDPEGRVIPNTTRDTAVSQLKALRDDIVLGKAKFDEVASHYSDCSSAKRGRDLGVDPKVPRHTSSSTTKVILSFNSRTFCNYGHAIYFMSLLTLTTANLLKYCYTSVISFIYILQGICPNS